MAARRPVDGKLVVATAEGQSLNAKGIVRYAWREAVEASGLAAPAPKLHDARHAYATHARRAGLTLYAVARLLGHRDVSLVARRYGHALPMSWPTPGASRTASEERPGEAWCRSHFGHAANRGSEKLQMDTCVSPLQGGGHRFDPGILHSSRWPR